MIYYTRHILNDAQMNYDLNKKEFLAVVFAIEKFIPHLIGSHVIVFIDNAALKHLLSKRDVRPRLMR